MITAVTCLWPPVPGSRSVQTSEKKRAPANMRFSCNSLSWSLEQDNVSQQKCATKVMITTISIASESIITSKTVAIALLFTYCVCQVNEFCQGAWSSCVERQGKVHCTSRHTGQNISMLPFSCIHPHSKESNSIKRSTKLQLCALSAQLNKLKQRENIHDTYRTLNFLSKPVKPETSTNDSVGNEKSHT